MAEHGWPRVTLESIAERASVSRATLYRRGITRESIATALAERAAAGWKEAIWPSLTAAGTAAERLELALRASCAAIDLHASILTAAPNPVVDRTSIPPVDSRLGDVFVAPFVRLLLDGAADGSLAPVASPTATATAIFSLLSHTYLELRNGPGGTYEATETLVALVLSGALPR